MDHPGCPVWSWREVTCPAGGIKFGHFETPAYYIIGPSHLETPFPKNAPGTWRITATELFQLPWFGKGDRSGRWAPEKSQERKSGDLTDGGVFF